jgi:enamine deaminase RidA (YjgF/YER057c/UK114 family)
MTATRRVLQPEGWPAPKGYVNGIEAQGRLVFIAGQVGWDPTSATAKFSKDFIDQFDQALANVLEVLAVSGGGPADITRMTIYVTDKKEYLKDLMGVGGAWKKRMGRNYPAMALVQVAALVEDDAKVEIEATAVI